MSDDPPFDNPLRCRECRATGVRTKYAAIWEPGRYGKPVRVEEWFQRDCPHCGVSYRQTLAETVAQAGVTRQGGDANGGSVSEANSTRSAEPMRSEDRS